MLLDPECKKENNIFFVKADSTFLPCCYLSSNNELLNYLGPELYLQLNLKNYTYDQIIKSEAWKRIEQSIESDQPIKACIWTCEKKEKALNQDLVGNIKMSANNDKFPMVPFFNSFKLYAYKKYDINDLSLKVNDNFVLTYRLTHQELKDIFAGAYEKPGINIKLECGVKLYCVVKFKLNAVRFTINTHGGNLNLRYHVDDFEKLKKDYEFQMNNAVEWDDYDPR